MVCRNTPDFDTVLNKDIKNLKYNKGSDHSCCFTGHRVIASRHKDALINNTDAIIKNLYTMGVSHFICGGALGYDNLAAKCVIKAKGVFSDISLTLALPCKDHYKNWHKKDITAFDIVKSAADNIVYVSDDYYDGCMLLRNRYMVENSSHCVFYMTSPRGGTAYTVKYALKSNLFMHNAITETP